MADSQPTYLERIAQLLTGSMMFIFVSVVFITG